jgi:hypothetical protein
VFETRVLKRIFGPRRDEIIGEWKRLHNEELYALYSSSNISRVINSRIMRWVGHVAPSARRDAYWVSEEKPEGRRPFGRWEDNIKVDLREVIWEAWIGLNLLMIGTDSGIL